MKQLMVQVERIVRPVRAMESRKLQMRRELLAHLELAVAQERSLGSDEQPAIDAAILRLGDPDQLTQQLQRTVPWIQRMLLTKFTVNPAVERWGTAAMQGLFGLGPITLMHVFILSALAGFLSAVPCLVNPVVRDSLNHSGVSPAHPACFILILLGMWYAIWFASCRLIMQSADPLIQFSAVRLITHALIVLALQGVMTVATTAAALGRWPNLTEAAGNLAVTILLIGISIWIASGVAALRNRYTEWMTLDIA